MPIDEFLAEVAVAYGKHTANNCRLKWVAYWADEWLEGIKAASTPLTAVLRRSVACGMLREALPPAESMLHLHPSPKDSLEARLAAIAGEAARQGHDVKPFAALVPKLQAIAAAAGARAPGPWQAAQIARNALRQAPSRSSNGSAFPPPPGRREGGKAARATAAVQ